MSRLDYVTIAIVAVCVAALVYLIYMTTNLLGGEEEGALTEVEQPADNLEDTYDDTYDYDGEGLDGDTSSLSDDNGNYNYDYDNPDELDKGRTSYDDTEDGIPNDASFDNYDNTSSKRLTTTASSGNYLVLAGSYKQEANAAAMVSKLKDLGYNEASVEPFNRGAYAVALVARYDSYAEAKSLVSQLEDKGIDAMVKKKD
jgi:hypothetical protein